MVTIRSHTFLSPNGTPEDEMMDQNLGKLQDELDGAHSTMGGLILNSINEGRGGNEHPLRLRLIS